MKVVIFDASTLISLSMAGLIGQLKNLKQNFDGKFIITSQVKYEVMDRPIKIQKFQLEALRIKNLLEQKVLEAPSSLGINDKEITSKTNEILNIANTTFKGDGKDLHLIDDGEASCLALSDILTKKGVKNILAIDERTTRMLAEKPDNLVRLLNKKLHTRITPKRENYSFFKNFKVIRSAEIIYVSYKKGLTKIKNSNALNALLYAVKFKGCAISGDEIKEIQNIKNH